MRRMKRSERDGKKVREKEEWSIMCVRERERERHSGENEKEKLLEKK